MLPVKLLNPQEAGRAITTAARHIGETNGGRQFVEDFIGASNHTGFSFDRVRNFFTGQNNVLEKQHLLDLADLEHTFKTVEAKGSPDLDTFYSGVQAQLKAQNQAYQWNKTTTGGGSSFDYHTTATGVQEYFQKLPQSDLEAYIKTLTEPAMTVEKALTGSGNKYVTSTLNGGTFKTLAGTYYVVGRAEVAQAFKKQSAKYFSMVKNHATGLEEPRVYEGAAKKLFNSYMDSLLSPKSIKAALKKEGIDVSSMSKKELKQLIKERRKAIKEGIGDYSYKNFKALSASEQVDQIKLMMSVVHADKLKPSRQLNLNASAAELTGLSQELARRQIALLQTRDAKTLAQIAESQVNVSAGRHLDFVEQSITEASKYNAAYRKETAAQLATELGKVNPTQAKALQDLAANEPDKFLALMIQQKIAPESILGGKLSNIGLPLPGSTSSNVFTYGL